MRRTGPAQSATQGTRAVANLASIIGTCRTRFVSPRPYLAKVLRQRRRGLPAPARPIPAAPAVSPA